MVSNSYKIEIQKTKNETDISIYRKNYQNPEFSIYFTKFLTNCERYAFVKNSSKKRKIVYDVLYLRHCPKKKDFSYSQIRRISDGKRKIIREIKRVDFVYENAKNILKDLLNLCSKYKYKKIGDLKIYTTKSNDVVKLLSKQFDRLRKIR